MTQQDIIDRAERAAKLVSDPLLAEAFERVRMGIFEMIEKTPIRDKDGLHELRLMLKLLQNVRAALDSAVRDGKVIAFRASERSTADRLKEIFFRLP